MRHEAQEQAALFRWALLYRGRYPQLDLLFHIPNGGRRHPREAANLKRQGVKAGVPDLFLPVARGAYHGLFIELKAQKNKPTDKQAAWMNALTDEGYAVKVCYGWQAAKETIIHYLDLQEH